METLLGNISWPQFLATALLIIVVYYSYITYRYYPDEIKSLTRPKSKPGFNPFGFDQAGGSETFPNEASASQTQEHVPFEETSEDTFDRIEQLIERIKPAIKLAWEGGADLQLMKTSLSAILKDFPDLKLSPFAPAIRELIQTECKNTGSLVLSEKEVQELWA